ncbi:MAG: putative baseplate assembly protein [Chloroflexi bacterium]|nr:putative baseplate assembly protein [Chloroflexota bacterium]
MPLPLPNLDDRDFEQLIQEATQRIRQSNTAWDDLTPSDPGVVLLEVFAYLTDTMIYRLNRLPDKVYIAFLRLLGVSQHPPSAASTLLRFSRARGAADAAIEIPRGTRVTLERSGGSSTPPIFMTTEKATLAQGTDSVDVAALQAEQVEGEEHLDAKGLPGLVVKVNRPPIIYGTGDALDLIVGVEADAADLDQRVPALQYADKTYRVWREVENFANPGDDGFVYTVDRMTGTVNFAPALYEPDDKNLMPDQPTVLGEVPPAGRSIRIWYRRGGGADGNVAANTLTALKDPIRGLQVMNPAPATGGRDEEALDNALQRGPKELHSLQRAVTADDFELLALKTLEVARAKAVTRAAMWSFGQRGTVEVILVPEVPDNAWQGDWLPATTLMQYATEQSRTQVQAALDERRPLGTTCDVTWAHYKTVRVQANIVVRREEDTEAVKNRVKERLFRIINPLPSPKFNAPGWVFGQALRVSNIYDVALAEPGVRWIDNVRLIVDEVPNAVMTVAADSFQAHTWYAGSENHVFRSLNDADGWETAISFGEDETVEVVRTHPERAGLVAAQTRVGTSEATRVYVSRDCGESWQNVLNPDFHIEDMVWILRDKVPVLLLATDNGLFELTDPQPGANSLQVLVNPQNQALSFYAVTMAVGARGEVSVAVAAQNNGGVYLSSQGGKSNTYHKIEGMEGLDVRVLAVQYQGPRAWLWSGTFAFGDEDGKGCFRWELRENGEDPISGWETFNGGWKAGSCHGLTFSSSGVLAATHRNGVLGLDPTKKNPQWVQTKPDSGLPVRDNSGRFVTIDCIAANPTGTFLLAGIAGRDDQQSGMGIYRAADQGTTFSDWKFALSSTSEFTDKLTLPETWLFTSGAHDISVVSEDDVQ